MSHSQGQHEWSQSYEHRGTSYRECTLPDCYCHQQWICANDRWSDAFETPSPRQRELRRQHEHMDAESPDSL